MARIIGDASTISQKRRLRTHQSEAFKYALSQKHPALIMQMRLGKCLVTIRRVQLYKPLDAVAGLRVLVLCPSAAIGGWVDELILEKETSVCILKGKTAHRKQVLTENQFKWYIANKEIILYVPEIATLVNWDVVIIDESFIRNPKTKVTKFCTRNFRDCPHRYLLTGTPAPESDLEYFTQLQWLDGYAFGYRNYYDFRREFFKLVGYDYRVKDRDTKQFICEYFGKRCFVKTRKDAGVEPHKVYDKRVFELPDECKTLYNRIEKEYAISDDKTTIWSPVRYQWLRKLCGGFEEGNLIWDEKYLELVRLLQGELKGESIVVWFAYNHELKTAYEYLKKNRIACDCMYGDIPFDRRNTIRKNFQAKVFPVILVQELVATMGVNFAVADTAIYFGRNPAFLTDMQTQDRIVHLEKSTSLLYLYFVVKDTVDEDIYLNMTNKRWKSDLDLDAAIKESTLLRVHKSKDFQKKLLNKLGAKR